MKKMDGKFKISLLFLAVILIIPVIGPHLIRHDPYAVIYALSDFLIMILSWLVKQSLRAFLFQEVQP